jgi:hypothetical protein
MNKELAMCQYTQLEEAQIKTDVRMCFAVNGENALLVSGAAGGRGVRTSSGKDLRGLMAQLPGLRCRAAFSCFNIYPTSGETLVVNKFLWETVHNGYYDAERGNALFGENIFVLGLAAELFDFLIHVTLEALDVAMIDFLVLLHHQLTTDGDAVGVTKLREELIPEVWARVEENIGVFENGEPKEAERAATLEHLVQISFMTPWRVDVLAGYMTPADMAALLADGPEAASGRMPSFGADCVGVRGSALLKLFRDWQVYDDVLCKRLSMKRNAALEAMDRAMYCGRSVCMYEEAAAAVDLCESPTSWFSLLPIELVERAVVPWIVRRNCEMIAPRQRRLATLKSLLELSSKFFDELEAAGGGGGGADGDVVMAADDDLFADDLYDAEDVQAAIEMHGLQIAGGGSAADVYAAMGVCPPGSPYPCDGGGSDGGGDDDAGCTGATASRAGSRAGSSAGSVSGDDGTREYPLDAGPRRYSRLERHGGVIDLAAPADGEPAGGNDDFADAM